MVLLLLSILAMYNYDNTLFDRCVFPVGLEKETITNEILLQCAEVEVLYGDIATLKSALAQWCNVMLKPWTKLLKTTELDYNPIENYNRTETETINNASTGKANGTNKVAGFEGGNLVTSNSTDQDSSTNSTNQRENHTSGNIGVTTSQQMIQQERDVAQYNIVQEIVNDFKRRFCLLVY